MKSCLIIAASDHAFWDFRDELSLIICADGGIKNAKKLALHPDITIGDGDSAAVEDYAGEVILLPKEKDESDTEACVNEAMRRGCRRIYLTGATGGRQDHFLANLFLLIAIKSKGAEGFIIDEWNEISIIEGETVLSEPHEYKYFSLIPVGSDVELSILGAKFNLDRQNVSRTSSLTISNETCGEDVRILSSAAMFLIRSIRRSAK